MRVSRFAWVFMVAYVFGLGSSALAPWSQTRRAEITRSPQSDGNNDLIAKLLAEKNASLTNKLKSIQELAKKIEVAERDLREAKTRSDQVRIPATVINIAGGIVAFSRTEIAPRKLAIGVALAAIANGAWIGTLITAERLESELEQLRESMYALRGELAEDLAEVKRAECQMFGNCK